MFGRRILILIPHADDEVVGYCAAIGRAQAAGAEIFALYLTHGCIDQAIRWPWDRQHHAAHVAKRRAEAETVAALLKIKPIGWADRPARHLWRNLFAVYAEIQQAIKDYAIDQIWLPAYEGGNADHDGLNAVGSKLAATGMSVLEFAEYNFFNAQTNAQQFPYPNGTETILTLTAAEQQTKRQALALYASEQGNLNYVGTRQETYRPLAAYDYSKPPHSGTLWYARFQWVPFRHPRVDFSSPATVSAAITAFLAPTSS